jgi:hypothetical protein
MPVWRGAVTGALSGVKKNAVMLLRWLPNFDYVTVMLPVLPSSGKRKRGAPSVVGAGAAGRIARRKRGNQVFGTHQKVHQAVEQQRFAVVFMRV